MEALDVQTLAGALGALIVTAILTWTGYKKEKASPSAEAEVLSGVIQDNSSIRENTAQLVRINDNMEDMVVALKEATEQMRENKAALIRLADIHVMQQNVGR